MIDLWNAPFYTYTNMGGFMFDTFKPSLPKEIQEWLDERAPGWTRDSEEYDDYFGVDIKTIKNVLIIEDPDVEMEFILRFMTK